MMRTLSQRFAAVLLALLVTSFHGAQAAGTAAGTDITNSVTVDFDVGGTPQQLISNTDTLTVQELIDVVATWQDAANIQTASPETDQLLTFLVRNTGNGVETFMLTINNSPVTGDNFDPVNPRIYIDGNGNSSYDGPITDPLYVPGSNDPVLDASGSDSVIIFVLNDIPAGSNDGETGDSRLRAASATAGAAGAATATVLPGVGDDGIDAVVGTSNADAEIIGRYEILNTPLDVVITKSAQVISDGDSCNTAPCNPVPGATILYELQVEVTGTGIADNLVITDSIPANTSFVAASITLDAVAQTDIIDADAGSFNSSIVTLDLGSVPGPVTRAITFAVTIN